MKRVLAVLFCLCLAGCVGWGIEVRVPASPAVSAAPVKPVRHMLLLSSGGADGAFGAGVLAGWTSNGTRPVFDVVTGISTGALQATAAFVGSEADGLLRAVYTNTRTTDILDGNGAAFLVKPGLYDLEPLRALLRAIITNDLLDRVAAGHRAGRRLLVGTTDLTNGRLVTWDMGAIATSTNPGRRERYIGVLLASVAVPGLIEPVTVWSERGEAASHGDGGVLAPILFDEAWLTRRGATVWIIANGHVSRSAGRVAAIDGAIAAGRRGLSQLLRRLLYTTVVATYFSVRERGGAFRLLALPDAVPEARNPFAFDPEEMRSLYEVGFRLGQKGTAWAGRSPQAT